MSTLKRSKSEAERIMRQLTARPRQIVVETLTRRAVVDPRTNRPIRSKKLGWKRQTIDQRSLVEREI